MSVAPATALTYRPEVDGLRAVAVLTVIAFHFGVPWLSGGFVGVDVFFVISGFLITSIVLREVDCGTFSLRSFYERRIRRILPNLLAVLSFTAVAAWFVLTPRDLRSAGESLSAACVFLGNFYFRGDERYFAAPSELKPLLHMWSLAVEEQFYLVFPPLLAWVAPNRALARAFVVVTLVASLALSCHELARDPAAVFFLPQYRAWELLTGSLLVLLPALRIAQPVREALALLGLFAILGASVFYDSATPFPAYSALLPCLGAAAVIQANTGAGTYVGSALGRAVPVQVGKWSYSLYLWHWPILVFAKQVWLSGVTLTALVLAALVTALLSNLAFRAIEQPSRTLWQGQGGLRSAFVLPLLGLLTLSVAGGVTASHDGFPGRLPVAAQTVAELSQEAPQEGPAAVMNRLCPAAGRSVYGQGEHRACRFGDVTADPSFFLWGDSHASTFSAEFERAATRNHTAGYASFTSRCAPLLFGVSPRCRNEGAKRIMADPSIHHVVLHARWAYWASDEIGKREGLFLSRSLDGSDLSEPRALDPRALFVAALESTLRAAALQHKRVSIISSTPEITASLPTALAKAIWWGTSVDLRPPSAAFVADHLPVEQAFARLKERYDFSVYYPHRTLCHEGRCEVMHEGKLLYSDKDHLSRAGISLLKSMIELILRSSSEQQSKVEHVHARP